MEGSCPFPNEVAMRLPVVTQRPSSLYTCELGTGGVGTVVLRYSAPAHKRPRNTQISPFSLPAPTHTHTHTHTHTYLGISLTP